MCSKLHARGYAWQPLLTESFSTKFFCNTKVAVLGEIFYFHVHVYGTELHKPT